MEELLDELYTETILDHFQHPRHAGTLPSPSARVTEHNPLCGDTITLDVRYDASGRVCDLAFTGQGCAISQAAFSLASQEIIGKSSEQIEQLGFSDVQKLLGAPLAPARVRCALLGLVALKKAGILYRASEKKNA